MRNINEIVEDIASTLYINSVLLGLGVLGTIILVPICLIYPLICLPCGGSDIKHLLNVCVKYWVFASKTSRDMWRWCIRTKNHKSIRNISEDSEIFYREVESQLY